jgi:hypothetical protein
MTVAVSIPLLLLLLAGGVYLYLHQRRAAA